MHRLELDRKIINLCKFIFVAKLTKKPIDILARANKYLILYFGFEESLRTICLTRWSHIEILDL